MAQSRQETDHAQREAQRATQNGTSGAQRATQKGPKGPQRATQNGTSGAQRATKKGPKGPQRATENGAKRPQRATQRRVAALRQHADHVAETGRDGVRQASETSAGAIARVARTGSALADAAQDAVSAWARYAEVSAWARYAEDVMRNISHATEALLHSRTIPEIMQVQVRLLYSNLQAFFDQSAKLADTASRVSMRPFGAVGEGTEQARSQSGWRSSGGDRPDCG